MLAFYVKFRAAVFVERASRALILDGLQANTEQNEVTNMIFYHFRV